MKFKNVLSMLSVTVGGVLLIGTVGNLDYYSTLGKSVPIAETVTTTVVGLVLIIPAIIEGVKAWQETR